MTNLFKYYLILLISCALACNCSNTNNTNSSVDTEQDALRIRYEAIVEQLESNPESFYGRSDETDSVYRDIISLNMDQFKSKYDASNREIEHLINSVESSLEIRELTNTLNDKIERIDSELEKKNELMRARLDSSIRFANSELDTSYENIDTLCIQGPISDSVSMEELKRLFPNAVIKVVE